MLRVLDGTVVWDRKNTKTLLDNQNMLTFNQIAAQIKLTEMWKASNGDLTEVGRSTRAKKSYSCDAAKVWNEAPEKIRTANSITTAKKAI